MLLSARQEEITGIIDEDALASHWRDWHWQMRHSVTSLERFEELLGVQFPKEQQGRFAETVERFPIAVTPYYLSLIDVNNLENDPVFKQSFPSPLELNTCSTEMHDPLGEDKDSPVPGITHRYPDRVLLLVSNMCAMYCRHCTRKRKVGDVDSIPDRDTILGAIDYIRKTPEIRDVLLSGGDPFLLSDSYLDWILGELRSIEHVEVVRIGTRTPVVLPYQDYGRPGCNAQEASPGVG